MTNQLAAQPAAWIMALLLLIACWPISRALRHEQLHPLAAYLLFTSMLVLVSAIVFFVLLQAAAATLPPGALEGAGPALVVALLSLLPGLIAGWLVVRRPQIRRMPK